MRTANRTRSSARATASPEYLCPCHRVGTGPDDRLGDQPPRAGPVGPLDVQAVRRDPGQPAAVGRPARVAAGPGDAQQPAGGVKVTPSAVTRGAGIVRKISA